MAGDLPPDEGAVRRAPPGLRVGLLDQRGAPAGARDRGRAPGPAHRGGRRRARGSTRSPSALAGRPRPRGDTPRRSRPSWPSAATTSTPARAAALAEVGLPADRLDVPMTRSRAARPRGVGLAVLLLARLDLLLLDEPTNDLDFAGLDDPRADRQRPPRGGRDGVARPGLPRPLRPPDRGDRRAGPRGARVRRGLERLRAPARRGPRAASTTRTGATPPSATAWRTRMRRQRAWSEEGVSARRSARRTPTRSAGRCAPSAPSSRRPRCGRPSGRWSGSTRSTSPGRAGACSCGWRRGAAAATSWRCSRAPWCARGAFRLGPVNLEVRRGDRVVDHRPERRRQEHPARGAARPPAAGRGQRAPRAVGRGRRDRAGAHGPASARRACSTPCVERTGLRAQEARALLAKFGLDADRVERPAADLSPGERTRALMAVLSAREVTCLVLDEPTNHLDLEAIEQLEERARRLRGDAAAGDPRPPDARARGDHPAARGARRESSREPRRSRGAARAPRPRARRPPPSAAASAVAQGRVGRDGAEASAPAAAARSAAARPRRG